MEGRADEGWNKPKVPLPAISTQINREVGKMPEDGTPEEEGHKTIGYISAIFLLLNTAAGAGVLNFPQSYKYGGGIVTSLCMQVLFCILTLWGLLVTNIAGAFLSCNTMQEMLLKTGGRKLFLTGAITIILYSIGSCTAYVVVIGDQIDRVMYSVYGSDFCHRWYLNRHFTIVIASVLLILPNIYSKRVDYLKYVSKLGVISIVFVVFVVVLKYYKSEYTAGNIRTHPKKWEEFTYIIPTLIYAFHCHVQSLPITSCMTTKTPLAMTIVCYSGFLIVVVLYGITGVYGYLTFGDKVMANIMLSYDAKDPEIVCAIVLLAIKICTVYPLVLFCAREAIIDIYIDLSKTNREEKELKLRIIVSTFMFLLTVGVGDLVPNIGMVIGFMGVFVAFFIFIYPGLGQLAYARTHKESGLYVFNVLSGISLTILGIVLAVAIFGLTVHKVIVEISRGVEKLCK